MGDIEWELQNYDTGHLQNQIAENWRKIDMYLQELKELNNDQTNLPSDRDMT